jgi:formamidopyrimidine-DNA glycosylase
MPELPEVEHLRRSLEPTLVGSLVTKAMLHRPDVLESPSGSVQDPERALLADARVTGLRRHGKQLAVISSDGRALRIHLGMSGRVDVAPWPERPSGDPAATHCHAAWQVRKTDGSTWWMGFRDPRRFGGLLALATPDELAELWRPLGPDAHLARPEDAVDALRGRRRQAKAALLDQAVLAGVGNIYADEALFAAGVHPLMSLHRLREPALVRLIAELQRILRAAIASGGSSLRDYRDASGAPGWFQTEHAVYGRGGLPCRVCGALLKESTVAGRTTSHCPRCQTRRPARSSCR